MKDNIKRIIRFLLTFLLIYVVSTLGVNWCIYHKIVFFKSPFTTIKLYKLLPQIRQKRLLVLSLVYGQALLLLAYTILFWFYDSFKKLDFDKKRKTSQGSAHWVDDKTLRKAGFLSKNIFDFQVIIGQGEDAKIQGNADSMRTLKKSKKYYGYCMEKEIGKSPKIKHMMLIGTSGSGKGVGLIIPTLLNYKHSCIVFDPAGENYEETARWRASKECNNGYVQYFDPQDINSTLHFNPLDWVRKDAKFIAIDVDNLCQNVIPNNPDSKDPFWDNSARTLLSLFVGYVLLSDKLSDEEKNLYNVANLISVLKGKSRELTKKKVLKSIIILKKQQEKTNEPYLAEEIEKAEEKLKEIKEKEERLKKLQEEYDEKMSYWKQLDSATERYLVKPDKSSLDVREEKRKVEMLLTANDREQTSIRIELGEEEEKGNDKQSLSEFIEKLQKELQEQEKNFSSLEKKGWKGILMTKTLSAMANIQTSAKAETTLASIVSVLNSTMSFFVEPVMAELMKDTSFSLNDFFYNKEPLTLYLCIAPNDIERCKKFTQLFIQSIFNKAYTNFNQEEKEYKRYKREGQHTLLFLLDEFVQLGKFDDIVKQIPFCRKYGLAFLFIVQGKTHLESLYKKEGADAILSNCHAVVIKGCAGETQTAEWVEKMLGKETLILKHSSATVKDLKTESHNVSQSEVGRSLMTCDEVLHMENWYQVVIFNGLNPLKCKKMQYFEYKEFLARAGGKAESKALPYYTNLLNEREEKKRENEEMDELIAWTLKEKKVQEEDEDAWKQIEDIEDEIETDKKLKEDKEEEPSDDEPKEDKSKPATDGKDIKRNRKVFFGD